MLCIKVLINSDYLRMETIFFLCVCVAETTIFQYPFFLYSIVIEPPILVEHLE